MVFVLYFDNALIVIKMKNEEDDIMEVSGKRDDLLGKLSEAKEKKKDKEHEKSMIESRNINGWFLGYSSTFSVRHEIKKLSEEIKQLEASLARLEIDLDEYQIYGAEI